MSGSICYPAATQKFGNDHESKAKQIGSGKSRSQIRTIYDLGQRPQRFCLKIQPRGRRCYFVYYRTVSHQQRKPAIGLNGKITTEEARQIAKRWIGGALAGQDISGQRKDSRSSLLIKDFAVRYLQEYAKHFKKPSSYKSDASNLSHHVLPLIRTKKVDEVSRADIEYVKNFIREGKTAARKAAKFRGVA